MTLPPAAATHRRRETCCLYKAMIRTIWLTKAYAVAGKRNAQSGLAQGSSRMHRKLGDEGHKLRLTPGLRLGEDGGKLAAHSRQSEPLSVCDLRRRMSLSNRLRQPCLSRGQAEDLLESDRI